MQYDEFIGQVQSRARLASRGEAERAVRSTFHVLSSRLTSGAARSLAGQLPDLAAEYLVADLPDRADRTGEPFVSDEFFQRAADDEGVDLRAAAFHVRAVLEVVGEAVGAPEMTNVREQLPDDYERLFAGSQERMPA